jgi:hypothetical protein
LRKAETSLREDETFLRKAETSLGKDETSLRKAGTSLWKAGTSLRKDGTSLRKNETSLRKMNLFLCFNYSQSANIQGKLTRKKFVRGYLIGHWENQQPALFKSSNLQITFHPK